MFNHHLSLVWHYSLEFYAVSKHNIRHLMWANIFHVICMFFQNSIKHFSHIDDKRWCYHSLHLSFCVSKRAYLWWVRNVKTIENTQIMIYSINHKLSVWYRTIAHLYQLPLAGYLNKTWFTSNSYSENKYHESQNVDKTEAFKQQKLFTFRLVFTL